MTMVDAGDPIKLCPGQKEVRLAGRVCGPWITATWSTTGDGQFLPDAHSLDATYRLGSKDLLNGVRLHLTTAGDEVVSDEVHINIEDRITVDAGPDVTACFDTPGITLSGLIQGSGVTGEWSTSGDGRFNDGAVEINAVYLPGAHDLSQRGVWVHLTSTSNGGCQPGKDSLLITFHPKPEVRAGEDARISAGEQYLLQGEVFQAGRSSWTTSGQGILTDQLYQSVAADAGERLHFILQASNGCGIATDTLHVEVMHSSFTDAPEKTRRAHGMSFGDPDRTPDFRQKQY